MFDNAKLTWHLKKLYITASTSDTNRVLLNQLALGSSSIDKAVRFSKDNRDPELGAVYLVICLCETALETNAPAQILGALDDLQLACLKVIDARNRRHAFLSETLEHQILELEEKFWKRINRLEEGGPAVVNGPVPDVPRRERH